MRPGALTKGVKVDIRDEGQTRGARGSLKRACTPLVRAGSWIRSGARAEKRIFIELMTSDHKLKTSREGSKGENYGT